MAFLVVLLQVTDIALILQIPSDLKPHFLRGIYFYGKMECGRGTKPNKAWGCENVTSTFPVVFTIPCYMRNYAIELPQVRFVFERNRIKRLTEGKRVKAERNLPLITSE